MYVTALTSVSYHMLILAGEQGLVRVEDSSVDHNVIGENNRVLTISRQSSCRKLQFIITT